MMTLVMTTSGEGVEGFPSSLHLMLQDTNFTSMPEYRVYAQPHGSGLVDYIATVDIAPRSAAGSFRHHFRAAGASVEMAIQAVAYTAMARLRAELPELMEGPYTYFPMRGPKDSVNSFVPVPATASPSERRAAFWFRLMDRRLQYVNCELWETRRRYNYLHQILESVRRRYG